MGDEGSLVICGACANILQPCSWSPTPPRPAPASPSAHGLALLHCRLQRGIDLAQHGGGGVHVPYLGLRVGPGG